MDEDESFDEFYAKLKDIVNSAFTLGETIPETKFVRKGAYISTKEDSMPRLPPLRNQRTLTIFL